jgi:ABC-type Na+ efflux pump permease subunit
MPGEQLFHTLTWAAFICACLVGPALTADSVNEERNNGTLGLLFLTHLNPLSISLGKLVGQGLLALYSIVSIVPVMALPVLLGGTDVESLAKTALVLFVTLILSLIIGMFASTICRKPWIAAALSLFILALLVAVVPLVSIALQMMQPATTWTRWLVLFTPSYSLSMATPSAALLPSNHLWSALSIQSLLAIFFLALINFLLPRVWKEGGTGRKLQSLISAWHWLNYGSAPVRHQLRTRLLRINPILWLSCRERFGPMSFSALLFLLTLVIFWFGRKVQVFGPINADFFAPMVAWIVGTPLLYLAFCFRFAAAASERFAVDRKTGALELILCTPIKTRDLIRGHWLGLLRRFWGAALLLFFVHAFTLNYIIEAIRLETERPHFNLAQVLIRSATHLTSRPSIPNSDAPLYIACLAVFTAAFLIVILWIALGWLGMFLSLKLKRQILAPWISLILLAVPPVPIFIGTLPLLSNQQLFTSNLFLAMFRLGFTGFCIVLANALLWLFLARRWTYQKLRAAPAIHRKA